MAFTQKSDTRVAVMMADGLEMIEGLTVVDLLYRAGIPCDTVAVGESRTVTSSHEVPITCKRTISDVGFSFDDYDVLVLPGGVPGTPILRACQPLCDALVRFCDQGKLVCAICAAPSILAELGLLEGLHATSYPSYQDVLVDNGAVFEDEYTVVMDDNVITSQGMGTALDFAYMVVAQILDDEAADAIADSIMDVG